jgi:hypothetical protein
MKTDKDEEKKVIVYSLNMAEACAIIASLANQMAAIDKGVSHGVVSMGCDGVRIVFGINCIA